MDNRPLRVFLCHSSADKPAVRELYEKLTSRGIDAWLDEKKLLPGQLWKIEIPKAVQEADAVIICLSNTSITKEGYVQREIKFALDFALEKPEDTIYLIPARLEDCKVPRSLSDWQWVDLFDTKGLDLIFSALDVRAKSLGLSMSIPAPIPIEIPNWPNIIQPQPSQAKGFAYETPVQERKLVAEAASSAPQSKMPVTDWVAKNKLTLSNGMEFMRVPAGKFIMGNNNGEDNEKPQHIMDIPYDYWMARYPVTNEQYNVYVKAKGILHPVYDWQNKKDHPVVNISWNTVMEYCLWLSSVLKAELPSSTMMVRLPTEAEWEKAARGTDDREYPWGSTFDKNKCNSNEGKIGVTTPVGFYSPQGDSLYSCADMAGNVWEWTHSEYKAYPYTFKDGREKKQKNVARVLRGGAYYFDEKKVRCTCRSRSAPHDWSGGYGFRIVVCLPIPA